MQAISMAVQRDERQAKTEAELDHSIANRLKVSNAMAPKPMSAADQKTMTSDIRMNFYKRTNNMAKYRELATESAAGMMAISTDSLKAKNAATYQRFMDEAGPLPDSVKSSPNFVRYAAMMKTVETVQLANKLNGLAWSYFQTMTDPADLKKALAWSVRSIELERSSASLDTYAQLLGKLGRRDEAIKHEEEALAKAKANGEPTEEYEKTLATFRKAN
jgi:tetratricopeptide (TPR) repeat protein